MSVPDIIQDAQSQNAAFTNQIYCYMTEKKSLLWLVETSTSGCGKL